MCCSLPQWMEGSAVL
ncbi:hypothetical protein SSYM_0851, partial [Serratia symbiotica str. Tucson]